MTAEPDALRLVPAEMLKPFEMIVRIEEKTADGESVIVNISRIRDLVRAASPAVQPAAGREEIRDAIIATAKTGMVPISPDHVRSGVTNVDEITDAILAALAHPPAQGSESGHTGAVEVLEGLLRSGGETWLSREQEWALKSAIAALSPQPGPASEGDGE